MAFGVKMTVKNLFFDRAMVVREVGKMNAKALGKAGAFVRRRARSSLRRRKAVSSPGSPPSVHSSDSVATLKNILFAYDRANQSVIIGPVKLNLHSIVRSGIGPAAQNILASGAVPGTLEHGGLIGVRKEKDDQGNWVRIPFGKRRRLERYVPVWKATAKERAASTGVHTIRKGNRTLNFYRVPAPRSVIVYSKIAPRPFMGPALVAEAPNFPSLWVMSAGGAAA